MTRVDVAKPRPPTNRRVRWAGTNDAVNDDAGGRVAVHVGGDAAVRRRDRDPRCGGGGGRDKLEQCVSLSLTAPAMWTQRVGRCRVIWGDKPTGRQPTGRHVLSTGRRRQKCVRRIVTSMNNVVRLC